MNADREVAASLGEGQAQARAPSAPTPPREPVGPTAWTRIRSILSSGPDDALQNRAREVPDFFHDLNLDQVIEAITAGRQEYDLAPFFHAHLTDLDAIAYRQEVMRDMEGRNVRQAVGLFADHMRTMRRDLGLAAKSGYELARQGWLLNAVEVYVKAVEQLAQALGSLDVASRGLRAFRVDLAEHVRSEAFRTLASEASTLAAALAAIRYCMRIHDGSVTVRSYDGEVDYSAAVEETFRKFQQGEATDYLHDFKSLPGMNHVQAQVLYRVALLNPNIFGALAQFCARHADFVDPTLARFEREVQFYGAYLDYIERFQRAGLAFCHPQLSDRRGDVFARATFDLALADRLLREKAAVVCNDFSLQGSERTFVVTGPNQGGKTTFARAIGQLHYLASLGCPVPGEEARLFVCDRLFTHFEREEDIASLHGKLEDDLVRIRRILDQATPNSIVIMNEIFSSTTLEDALFLGREVLTRVTHLDALCVFVTFLDALAAPGDKTVSMVATVDPRDPALCTFKVERGPADGLAYALAIAEKHRVTHRWLQERIRR